MFVTVHAKTEMHRAQSVEGATASVSQEVDTIVRSMGLQLEPLHPGSSDPELAAQFYVSVPDEETGQEVCRRLQESGSVAAAYLKPPDAPPS